MPTQLAKLKTWSTQTAKKLDKRRREYLSRRPHRTFRLTRRRDVPKRVVLPGYIAFANETIATLWRYKTVFGGFLLLYIALTALFVGVVSQGDYRSFVQSLQELGPNLVAGHLDKTTQTVGLFAAAVSGALNQRLEPAQQVIVVLLSLFAWLVTVWLLRQLLAGNKVNLRDGLYNSGAPVLSTICILLILGVQFVPGAVGVIIYATASIEGLLTGAESMAFAFAAVLLLVLSLYWASATFLAGVIVTLPGTYPLAAMKTAGDLAFGRRTAIVLRLVWLALVLLLMWALLLIPTLLIDTWLNQPWLPLVPFVVALLNALTVVLTTSYIYLLYRKLIDDGAKS